MKLSLLSFCRGPCRISLSFPDLWYVWADAECVESLAHHPAIQPSFPYPTAVHGLWHNMIANIHCLTYTHILNNICVCGSVDSDILNLTAV